MTRVAMTNTFVDSLAGLGTSNARDLVSLLERVLMGVHEPDADARLLEDESGRSVDALRVNGEIAAIARRTGDQLVLLHSGRYDSEYEWVRSHCHGCDEPDKGRWISIDELPRGSVPGLMSSGPVGKWHITVDNSWQLGRALDALGLFRSAF